MDLTLRKLPCYGGKLFWTQSTHWVPELAVDRAPPWRKLANEYGPDQTGCPRRAAKQSEEH